MCDYGDYNDNHTSGSEGQTVRNGEIGAESMRFWDSSALVKLY
jgi:hypothetical protein